MSKVDKWADLRRACETLPVSLTVAGDGRLEGMAFAVPALLAERDKLEASRDALLEALLLYMSQFGQGLEAHGIPMGPSQEEADRVARAAIENASET